MTDPEIQRTPPHSVMAEQGVLSSIAVSNGAAISQCRNAGVGPAWFFVPAHKTVLQELYDAHDAGKPIALDTFTARLEAKNLLPQIGGDGFITGLFTANSATAAAIDHYIGIARDYYILRESIRAAASVTRRAYSLRPENEGNSPMPLLDEMESHIDSIRSLGRNGAMPGKSIVDLAEMDREIFQKDSLLGNRFLCRGMGMLFIGPTGIGKSTAGLQMDICWSCGREAFGIKPARPLKILHVQSENDEGDLAEMAGGIVKQLALDERERELVRQNFIRYDVRGSAGEEFIAFLRAKVREHRPELAHIDPLEAYAGGDLRDPEIATPFLRIWIDKILVDYSCGIIINHHTTKTIYRDTSQWSAADWAYAGAGGAVIANWPRASISIEATNAREVFKFHVGKRWTRIGWAQENGESTNERVFCWHGNGNIFWRDATETETEALLRAKPGRPIYTREDLKAIVPLTDLILKHVLLEKRPEGLGYHRARAFLAELIAERELFEHRIKRKGTNPETWIGRHEPGLL